MKYFENKQLNRFLILSPVLVMILTRLGIELFTSIFDAQISWIPAFLGYYVSIIIVYLIIRYVFNTQILKQLYFKLKPVPKAGLLILTVILPAVLPIAAFITQSQYVPTIFYVYILLFSLINAPFEEIYWRGILAYIPGNNIFRNLYTAGLFSFSHFVFWDYWYNSPIIMIPTVVSTFVMGLLWMHFMNKRKNILYPVLSHIVVDILNLSVAVYSGLITPPGF
ncbi:MAG TPA: CPBP family intramembrane glutamic endopeptidase [Bacteroidales bacterium]|nr:CPBP family intramembrane glutamic endopeptidase [Bacteroidales bacterium]